MVKRNKKDALIILAASKSSLLLIQKAKKFQFALIIIDRDKNAPGFEFADEKIILSTYEEEPIIHKLHLLEENYNFKGLLTRSSGIPVITMAYIAKEFNLSAVNPEVAKRIVFKDKLMEECKKLGIPAPRHQCICSLNKLNLNEIEYPVIIKPSISVTGKKHIFLINNESELIEKFALTKLESYNGFIDIEEYIEGQDCALMGFASNGILYPLVLYDEINYFDDNSNVKPYGICIPSKYINTQDETTIYNFAQNVINKLNINNTYFNLCFRFKKNGIPKLIEIHLDMGGDCILDKLIPESSNLDIIDDYIHFITLNRIPPSKYTFNPVLMVFGKNSKGNVFSNVKLIKGKTISDIEKYIQNDLEMI